MTVASLTREIEAAREEFRSLNLARWDNEAPDDFAVAAYTILAPETEARLNELALGIARLSQFRSWLYAKTISSPPAEQ